MNKRLNIIVIVIALFMVGCAGTSRLYPNAPPEKALHLVEVMILATSANIQNNRYMYEPLAAAGIHEAKNRDGSIGVGRVFCCDGKMEEAYFNYFFIPEDIKVEAGDIAEIRTGSKPKGGKSSVNTIVRVVQKKNDLAGTCRWWPRDRVYDQVLYCDWMPEKGWVKYKGRTWVKSL
jgi:hypothetical protein